MAIVVIRGKKYHIQWYDRATGKTNSKSTGLEVSNANLKKAKGYAQKLQDEIDKKYDGLRANGFKPKTIKDAFDHLLRNNQHKDPKTILDYKRFFRKFSETFPPDQPCSIIDKISVESWLNEIKKLNLSQNSIHAYGKQCTHFMNFLFEYDYIRMFKINREVKTKPEVKEIVSLRDEDIKLTFSNLEEKSQQFKTLIFLLFYTGLRSSDLLSLTVENLDVPNMEMHYFMVKGKKYRHIPLHKELSSVLGERIEIVKSGKLLGYSTIESIGKSVTSYFEQIGIGDKGYSARTFRKTFITLCRNRFKIDAAIVRELVGHTQITVADRYYNSIDMETMKTELNKFNRPS